MDQLSETRELLTAWRALSTAQLEPGWATIPLLTCAPCVIRAGRHYPGNEEALLIGFHSGHLPSPEQLPQGRGFSVSRIEPSPEWDNRTWLCLERRASANYELFVMMAKDLVTTLELRTETGESQTLQIFLARVRAWQSFMQRNADMLTPAEELGMIGELTVLGQIIAAGVPASVAVESWRGPVDGLHDFVLGPGAIEAKTTLSDHGFVARVGSLDQLDTSIVSPLFLAAVRLRLRSDGKTLADEVGALRRVLQKEADALNLFGELLIRGGYIDVIADRYRRRFVCTELRILPISLDFPRLTRSGIHTAIREARYDVDIDQVPLAAVQLVMALGTLGVI